MEESMYVLLTDGRQIDRMSPRAKEELDKQDLITLRQAVEAIADGTPQSEVDLTGFDCRIIPMADADGESVGSNGHCGDYLAMLEPVADGADLTERLTPTQIVVAEYAASGNTVEEIAQQMGRSPHTIKTHLRNIYERLGISSRVELASQLWRDGA